MSVVMAAVTAFCPGAVLAYADDPATGTLNLFASVSGAYTLVIPASVELSKTDGGKGIGTYSATIPVRVKGDLADNQYVTVSVATPTMTCSDGSTATVSLDNISKTEWSASDVAGEGTAADYAVSAVLGTPGAWNGTMSFGCEVGTTGISFNIGPYATYYGDIGMTWVEWCASEYNTAGYQIYYNRYIGKDTITSLTTDDIDYFVRPTDVIVNGNTYYNHPTPEITFTIGDTSYTAIDGMTWGDWVVSTYNTDGYYWRTEIAENTFFSGSFSSIIKDEFLVSHDSTAYSGDLVYVWYGSNVLRDDVILALEGHYFDCYYCED